MAEDAIYNKNSVTMENSNLFLLKIKKLSENAMIPSYAHDNDSGMDLYAREDVRIPCRQPPFNDKNWKLVKTGIAIELPPNTEAQIRPRSGLAYKHGITVLNTPGTIDEGYRGEIGVLLLNNGVEDYEVKKGMKIAQMVIMPVLHPKIETIDELSDTKRGDGGFGSTGV